MEKRAILRSMFGIKEDVLGKKEFFPVTSNFYRWLAKSGMDKSDYEEFMKKLYREGSIKIDLEGGNDLQYATVIPTDTAEDYINKQPIGF